jgi:hypothetical protein
MISVKTTLRIVDTLLRAFSNTFMSLGVCLYLNEFSVISRVIAVNVVVEPQVGFIWFQANRTESIRGP